MTKTHSEQTTQQSHAIVFHALTQPVMACTKRRNVETKRPKRNHRNDRNETTETTETKRPKRNDRNETTENINYRKNGKH